MKTIEASCPTCRAVRTILLHKYKENPLRECRSCSKIKTFTAGLSTTRLYSIWYKAKSRCENENNSHFSYYGNRGLVFCSEWDDFLTFKLWADNNGYSDRLTLDRIDNNIGYYPTNCRWATKEQQMFNTRKPLTNTSGVKGVSYIAKSNKWKAQVKLKGKNYQKDFKTIEEAVIYVKALRLQLHEGFSNHG